MDKTLFVVRALPYEAAGTPVVVRNLLKHLSAEDYLLLGRRPHPAKRLPKDVKQKMFQIPIAYTKGHRFWKRFSILPGLVMGIYIIKRYRIQNIVGVFQDDASLYLGYLLARLFPSVKFYPYLMDLYADQKPEDLKRQEKIFKRADSVLLINSGMKQVLQRLYPELDFRVIPMIMPSLESSLGHESDLTDEGIFKIYYSGTINQDRLETLRVFTKVISKYDQVHLIYLTPSSEASLKEMGIFNSNCSCKFLSSQSELLNELKQASLLYIPLSFTIPKDKTLQMRTVFGAKTMEYLAVKRPILVHCLDSFFTSEFFKEYDAGYVLNSLDEQEVEDFILNLLKNYPSTQDRVLRGGEEMSKLFQPDSVVAELNDVLR